MGLKEELGNQLKVAMKNRETIRVATIRLIRDAIQKTELDERIELDDAAILAVLGKMIRNREESIAAFDAGGRKDLSDRERAEIEIIRGYMPQPMSAQEIVTLVEAAIKEAEAAGPQDMGKVMKLLKGKYEGRASGKDVSEEAKRRLAAKS